MVTEYVCASSYTSPVDLAHRPRGTPARHSLSLYKLDEKSGQLTLMTVKGGLDNAAFLRSHPKQNIFYCVTESIKDNGHLVSFSIDAATGQLHELERVGTFGRSSCYITLSKDLKFVYVVNYWDSTMVNLVLDYLVNYIMEIYW